MSTLELEHIKHTSSSSNNLSTHSDGSLTLGNLTNLNVNGNLGVGTTTGSESLNTTGNIRLQTNNKVRLEYLNSTGAYVTGTTGGAALGFEYLSGGADHEIFFETHNSGVSHREVMRIDKDGYVTQPYQPVSQISCTNAGLTTNGNRYEGTANVNNGNGWSNSSNQFTAPVAGTYLVNFSGWTNYTPGYGYMGIYKNGANYYTWHYNHGNYQMHTFASGTLYIDLAQNDTIYFVRAGAGNGTYQGMYFNISLFG